VASLPDGWITRLITQFAEDARFRTWGQSREAAIGCARRILQRHRRIRADGASGFLTCIYAITKINYTYQIPLLIGITLRDGRATTPSSTIERALSGAVIQAIDLPFVRSSAPTTSPSRHGVSPQPGDVAARARRFTREVLRGEA